MDIKQLAAAAAILTAFSGCAPVTPAMPTWYFDGDSDGYGDSNFPIEADEAPTGYVANNTDCNDGDADISPNGIEVDDGKDNNCDGRVDEAPPSDWYLDSDGDGYGDVNDTTPVSSETDPSSVIIYSDNNLDCNDADAAISPGVKEQGDSLDNDCDGLVDEGFSGRDIVFLLDSSGSLEQSGWDAEKSFVISMLSPGGPYDDAEETRIGIVRYSSAGSVEKIHYFTQEQDRNYIIDLIDGLAWTQGTTAHRTALENAVDIHEWTGRYEMAGEEGNQYIAGLGPVLHGVILFTDGTPYPYQEQNPCKNQFNETIASDRQYYYAALAVREDIAALGLDVAVIGFGTDWNPSVLSCLGDIQINSTDVNVGFFEDWPKW